MLVDSAPYREREAPLPPFLKSWCMVGDAEDIDKTARTMQQWRAAYDIATRLVKEHDRVRAGTLMPPTHKTALEEYHELPADVLVLTNLRWRALLGLPFKVAD
jgi:hypothetical protein